MCLKRLREEIDSEPHWWRREVHLKTVNGIKKLICEGNLRLVIACVKKYRNTVPSLLSELIAEGNIGLIESIDGFDVDRGFRFSTYACVVIKSRMRNLINTQNLMLTRGANQQVGYLITAEGGLRTTGITNPTEYEIKNYLNENGPKSRRGYWKEHHIALMREHRKKQQYCSLDHENDGAPLSNIMPSEEIDSTIRADSNLLWESMSRHIGPRNVGIMQRRYNHDESLKSIGDRFNITRERVRQIEIDTLTRMRIVLNRHRTEIIPLHYLLPAGERRTIRASIARWSSYPDPRPVKQHPVDDVKDVDLPVKNYVEDDPTTLVECVTGMGALSV